MSKTIWSFDVLLLRCVQCKGIVEIPPDQDSQTIMLRHIEKVHGVRYSVDASHLEIDGRPPK